MELDPDVRELLERAARMGLPPVYETAPAMARELAARRSALTTSGSSVVNVRSVKNETITDAVNAVRVRVYRPWTPGPLPVIIYAHGGGWVVGSIDASDPTARLLCDIAGAIVVSVEYRLAPENRFPSALDDVWTVVEWAADNMASLGGMSGSLSVCGESAGGNIAAAVALRARDSGLPLASQVLLYPAIDALMGDASHVEHASALPLSSRSMSWYWDQYVGDTDRTNGFLSPIYAERHVGVAPALVITAGHDPLRDEGERYASVLTSAGVWVLARRYASFAHGFVSMAGSVPAVLTSVREICRAYTALIAADTVNSSIRQR
jgi:acetyl esterase